jgi:glycolate oxidase
MSYMFATPDLDTMQRVRRAFDPANIANPEKLFPTPRLCGERSRGSYAPHPIEAAGLAEVF